MRVKVAVIAVCTAVVAGVLACGTDPVGVESCRKIERARCENAPSCNIDLTNPVHRGDSPEANVGACIQYYEDACLHGYVAPTDPGGERVQACVDAINNGGCDVVRSPEKSPACGFLVPPAPPVAVDAAAEAQADAATGG